MFETNVGAGLPVIDTLNNLIASGDQVPKYKRCFQEASILFLTITFQTTPLCLWYTSKEEGYTEPDPKIDLSGVDVARKILILARESGLRIELEDIVNNSFLPEECLKTKDNESF